MAYSSIVKPSDYFNTLLYTGNATGSTARTVGFDPDWIWVKNRGGADNHYLMDKVRGLDWNLETNNSDAQARDYLISGTTSTGWTSSNSGEINANNGTFVAWNWKANGAGSSNTDGTITSTVSANTTAGFSIVKYVGNSTAGATVGHGLGVAPKVIIIKQTTGSTNWTVYHIGLGSSAKYLYLDATNAVATDNGNFDNVPTSSTFLLGSNSGVNASSGSTYIAYCFAEKKGYSKFGSYTGNGNADGTFVYTGFKPSLVICKKSSSTGDWELYDNKRNGYNGGNVRVYPNASDAEGGTGRLSLLSNGFKITNSSGNLNGSGDTFIYMAFAAEPLVANSGSNGVPATAR